MKSKKQNGSFTLLRLYIAGESQKSLNAIANLNNIRDANILDPHKVEIINTLDHPARVIDDGVLVTPTLIIKKDSLPARTIIGDLSDKSKVLISLQFEKPPRRGKKKPTRD